MYCFECIKAWSNTANECPYCKQRFSEITKYAVTKNGLTKLETVKAEFKKQIYEEEVDDLDDGNTIYEDKK